MLSTLSLYTAGINRRPQSIPCSGIEIEIEIKIEMKIEIEIEIYIILAFAVPTAGQQPPKNHPTAQPIRSNT